MKDYRPISHEPYKGTFGSHELKHLLKRSLFGITKQQLTGFKNKSLEEVVNTLLTPDKAPEPPLNHYQNVVADGQGVPYGETWVNAPNDVGGSNARRVQSIKSWWIQNMHFQNTSVHEKMVLFWHNHFATELSVYKDPRKAYIYYQTMHEHALGNFKDLVKAITLDPAMLIYLNGTRNTKNAPDENYARELQELFTIGKGPDSKYTESDVREAARILTGFRARNEPPESYFQASQHDEGDKTFSEFYNNTVIRGRSGADGANELDELLQMLFEQQEVSKFIVRKLYTFFVYYDITPAIEQNIIKPLAEIFRAENYEISPVLKALLSSDHFFDPELKGAYIKSPFEYVIGSTIMFKASWPNKEKNLLEFYLLANDLNNVTESCDQSITNPPNVAGWPAYYQSPAFYQIWINTNTISKRSEFTDKLLKTGLKRSGKSLSIEPVEFVKDFDEPENPDKLIDEMVFLLFQLDIADSLKKQLKTEVLLEGQSTDYYWTEQWQEYLQSPTSNNKGMVNAKLKSLLHFLTALPEYQLI